jgi:hypothetical protein
MVRKKVRVSRRSAVGYGYNANVRQTEQGLEVMKTTKPDHAGTLRQVSEAMDNDRELASYKSGGTYFSEAWFIKYEGAWCEVVEPFGPERLFVLLEKKPGYHPTRKYIQAVVWIEVECPDWVDR